MPAFLPRSQADLGLISNPDALVGHTIEVAVIKVNKKRGNIIVSRRQFLEDERDRRLSKILEAPLEPEVPPPPITSADQPPSSTSVRVSGPPVVTSQARSAVSETPQTNRVHCLFIDLEEDGLSCSYQWREGLSASEQLQPPPEDKLIALSKLKDLASTLSRVLQRLRTQPSNCLPDLAELEDAGVELYEKILPVHVAEELHDEQECAYLEIHIPPELSWIPWELLSDGDHFLCQRFKIARRLQKMGKLFRAAASRRRDQRSDRGALILVGDTSGLKAAEKEASDNEQRTVLKCFDSLGLRPWLYADMTSTEILRQLKKDYDICHFIGHGHYDEAKPEQSGWKLKDGSILTCTEIERQVRSRAVFPFLIFANACDSARPSISQSETYISLLYHAFLRQGVPHYIGTLGQILDDPAKEFVRYFYESLADGQSVGEALTATRREFFHHLGVPIWAYYVHYGDPTYRFVEKTATRH